MSTIRDVATRAGVSIASVSAVLNDSGRVSEATRRRIWDAVEAVGYAPNIVARSLRTGRTKLIGMVVGDITNPFCAGLVRVVERAAIASGFSVIVCNVDADEARVPAIIDHLRGQGVAGILLTPIGPPEALIRQIQAKAAPPIVTFDQKVPGLARDFVGFDNRAAIRMLVDYLIRLGHARIALINGRVGRWTADEREAGFLAAMASAGLDVDTSLIARPGFEGESAYAATSALLGHRDPPTAIIAANNVTALGSLQACLDLGFQCPRDISIAGVDDVPWSGLVRPRVTIVSQPMEQMGALAIEWLLERIAEPDRAIAPRERIFAPFIVAGESCRDIVADTAVRRRVGAR
jgi:LacI family transcriptional regulator